MTKTKGKKGKAKAKGKKNPKFVKSVPTVAYRQLYLDDAWMQ